MQPGDVFQGELTLTNYGLIRADNLKYFLPANDEYFKYEFMQGLPTSLAAKDRIVIPFRVVALKSLTATGTGTGGGGGCYGTAVTTSYDYTCANNNTSSGSTSTNIGVASTACGSGGYSGIAGGGGGGGTATSGGSSSTHPGVASTPSTLSGSSCQPACPDGSCKPPGN